MQHVHARVLGEEVTSELNYVGYALVARSALGGRDCDYRIAELVCLVGRDLGHKNDCQWTKDGRP